MNKSAPFRNPLVIALDVDSREEALMLADQLADVAGGFKIGPRLVLRYGADFVKEISKHGPVFLDNKHFDIPSTMVAAVKASFDAGASVVTVHAMSGPEALAEMAKLEAELNKIRPFRILAVTILTSWTGQSFVKNFKAQPLSQHVSDLAETVKAAGLTGLVCSPEELTLLNGKGFFLLTPGIRFDSDDKGDQQRTARPAEALRGGSNALVVGRPIIHAHHPLTAARQFLENCKP